MAPNLHADTDAGNDRSQSEDMFATDLLNQPACCESPDETSGTGGSKPCGLPTSRDQKA